jgi:hypothetical protein
MAPRMHTAFHPTDMTGASLLGLERRKPAINGDDGSSN